MAARDTFKEQMALLFEIPVDQLKDELELNKDLYASSLHYFGMLSGIEELTGKTLEYETIKACKTVGDILSLLD